MLVGENTPQSFFKMEPSIPTIQLSKSHLYFAGVGGCGPMTYILNMNKATITLWTKFILPVKLPELRRRKGLHAPSTILNKS